MLWKQDCHVPNRDEEPGKEHLPVPLHTGHSKWKKGTFTGVKASREMNIKEKGTGEGQKRGEIGWNSGKR